MVTAVESASQMNQDEAYNFLFQNVLAPAFFEKLAEHGIQPTTEAEADLMLEIGEKLNFAKQQETVKSAGDNTEFLRGVSTKLDDVMQARGYNVPTGYTKQAAALAANPQISQAAAAYQAAIAQNIINQQSA